MCAKRLMVISIFLGILLVTVPWGATVARADPNVTSFELTMSEGATDLYFWQWPVGATLTVTIDDPATTASPDFQSTVTAFEAQEGTSGFGQEFDYVTKPGDVCVVTDGTTTKTLIVPAITIEAVDVATDTLRGTAAPGAHVGVEVPGADTQVTADAAGDWTAEFSGLADIVAGAVVDALERDEDGDLAVAGWRWPSFELTLYQDRTNIYFARWPVGDALTVTIDDPATSISPDYQSTATAVEDQPGSKGFNQDFEYVAKPGDVCVVTNGSITKTLTIAAFTIEAVDVVADTVRGTAEPDAELRVEAGDSYRVATTDARGTWIVDFSGLLDIVPGVLVAVMQNDGQDELTVLTWAWPEEPAPAPAPKNDLPSSVVLPGEVVFTIENVGNNLLLAVIFAVIFGLTSTVFNFTLKNNSAEIAATFAPVRRRMMFVRRIPAHQLIESVRRRVGGRWLEHVLIVLLAGLIYSFLDPKFGRNWEGLVTFIALTLSVAIVTYTFEGLQALTSTRHYRVAARLKLFPLAIAIAVVCVLISRVTASRPGYVFGVVALLAFLGIPEPDEKKRGRLVFIASVTLLAVGVVAWGLTQPFKGLLEEDASALKVIALVCKYTFLTGLEGVLFALIPLRFMPGWELQRWNKWVWGGLFTLTAFLFWLIVINRGMERELYGEPFLRDVNVQVLIGLLAFWIFVTVAAYLFFYLRRRVAGAVPRESLSAEAVMGEVDQEPAAHRPQAERVTDRRHE